MWLRPRLGRRLEGAYARASRDTVGRSRGAGADADAAAAKKKKKKDKSRLTDLEDYDLEGEDPETTEEMLRRKASKKAGDSRVLQKVFGDIDDIDSPSTALVDVRARSAPGRSPRRTRPWFRRRTVGRRRGRA